MWNLSRDEDCGSTSSLPKLYLLLQTIFQQDCTQVKVMRRKLRMVLNAKYGFLGCEFSPDRPGNAGVSPNPHFSEGFTKF